MYNGEVIYKRDNADGKLHNKRRKSEYVNGTNLPQLYLEFNQVQVSPFPQEMRQQDKHAEKRSQRSSQSGSGYAHVERKHEHIIQYGVGYRSKHQSEDSQLRAVIISHQAAEQENEQQEWGKCDNIPHITDGFIMDCRRGTKQFCQRL